MLEPKDCQVSVVGGGALGTAATYFLAREGYHDIQLTEAGDLASASTRFNSPSQAVRTATSRSKATMS